MPSQARRHRLCLVFSLLSLLTIGCIDAEPLPLEPYAEGITLETHVTDWREEVIYQVLVDRFEDGDANNNFNVDKRALGRYHGGDWQGVIDRLDYLQDLGVTTLWISPVVRNVEEDAGFASYHGYWTQDFLRHNPHFGNLEDLRRLSDALHARGMKLILDVVTNHVGQVFFYDINGNGRPDEWMSGSTTNPNADPFAKLTRVTEYDPDYDARTVQGFTSLGESGPAPIVFFHDPSINRMGPGPAPLDLDRNGSITTKAELLGFSNPEWYHRRGKVTDWDSNPPPGYLQGEQTLYGDFPGGLKDLATEKDDVRNALIQVFTYWIDVTDADGFRIDTLKHVEQGFWEAWAPAMRQHAANRGKSNFFMFGEVFDGNDELLGRHTGPNQVDSVFYFSQKFRIFDNVFKCPPGNSAPYCRQADGTFRQHATGAVETLLQERRVNYNATPQPGGATDAQGAGLSPQQLLVNFMDNHDVSRYLYDRNELSGLASLHTALTYLLTTDGIPCLYYGTEQAFFGGNDPGNREDMDDPYASRYARLDLGYTYKPWNRDNPTFQHIKRLTAIRKQNEALTKGDLIVRWASERAGDERDAGILAFERSTPNQRALVVLNTHETKASTTQAPDSEGAASMLTGFAPGTTLVDLLAPDGPTFSVGAAGALALSIDPQTARILIPR